MLLLPIIYRFFLHFKILNSTFLIQYKYIAQV